MKEKSKGLISKLPLVAASKSGWPWTRESIFVEASSYPRITIVTPSYNQGQFIEETIRSVLLQNYPNLEYIIIDGGSTDNSVSIIKKYEPWLTYWVSEPDRGQSHAINKGLERATGELSAYLNSDDVLVESTLFAIAATYLNSDSDVFYGHAYITNARSKIRSISTAQPFSLEHYKYELHQINQPGSFWRHKAWQEIGAFNEENKTCMDGEFFLNLFHREYKFCRLDFPVSYFRIHMNSITGSDRSKLVYEQDHRRLLKTYCQDSNLSAIARIWMMMGYYFQRLISFRFILFRLK